MENRPKPILFIIIINIIPLAIFLSNCVAADPQTAQAIRLANTKLAEQIRKYGAHDFIAAHNYAIKQNQRMTDTVVVIGVKGDIDVANKVGVRITDNISKFVQQQAANAHDRVQSLLSSNEDSILAALGDAAFDPSIGEAIDRWNRAEAEASLQAAASRESLRQGLVETRELSEARGLLSHLQAIAVLNGDGNSEEAKKYDDMWMWNVADANDRRLRKLREYDEQHIVIRELFLQRRLLDEGFFLLVESL